MGSVRLGFARDSPCNENERPKINKQNNQIIKMLQLHHIEANYTEGSILAWGMVDRAT